GERSGAMVLDIALGRNHRAEISLRQVERECAADARFALKADLTAQKPGQLAADREAQPGAAVLAAGGAVRLLEGLEDDFLLVLGNADSGVNYAERYDRLGA